MQWEMVLEPFKPNLRTILWNEGGESMKEWEEQEREKYEHPRVKKKLSESHIHNG